LIKKVTISLFEERLKYSKVSKKFNKHKSDGVIIVSPEYKWEFSSQFEKRNRSSRWHCNPFLFKQLVLETLRFTSFDSFAINILEIKAWTFTANFPVAKVQDKFDDYGVPHKGNQRICKKFYRCSF
jgi:hypothetical protein